jgi:hypothetical protein
MRNFAKRLVAYETLGNKSSGPKITEAFQACEELRPHLATLMGNAGFRALVSRSLTLAGAEVPWLRAVNVTSDGSLEGLDKLGDRLDPVEIAEGKVVLLAQLIGLLMAFIGEKLTVRLLREVWPKLSVDDLASGNGITNEKTK